MTFTTPQYNFASSLASNSYDFGTGARIGNNNNNNNNNSNDIDNNKTFITHHPSRQPIPRRYTKRYINVTRKLKT